MLNCLLRVVAIVIFPALYMAFIKQPFLLIKANGGSRQTGLFCQFIDFHGKSPHKGLDLQVYFMVYTLNVEQNIVKSEMTESFQDDGTQAFRAGFTFLNAAACYAPNRVFPARTTLFSNQKVLRT